MNNPRKDMIEHYYFQLLDKIQKIYLYSRHKLLFRLKGRDDCPIKRIKISCQASTL